MQVSITDSAASTQSTMRMERESVRGSGEFEEGAEVLARDRGCGVMKGRPVNILTRQNSSFRCASERRIVDSGVGSLQKVSAGRLSHHVCTSFFSSTSRLRQSIMPCLACFLKTDLQTLDLAKNEWGVRLTSPGISPPRCHGAAVSPTCLPGSPARRLAIGQAARRASRHLHPRSQSRPVARERCPHA